MRKFTISPSGARLQFTIIVFVLYIAHSTFYIPVYAQTDLSVVNQKVCFRFEEDMNKLAAIMEEVRDRNGITETRVAFGGSDTPIKSADYWINYAAEAIAFQKAQKYTSQNQLKSSLEILKGKALKAKSAVGKAIDSDE